MEKGFLSKKNRSHKINKKTNKSGFIKNLKYPECKNTINVIKQIE